MEKKIKTVRPNLKITSTNTCQSIANEKTTPWPKTFGIPNTMLRSALFGIQRERTTMSAIDDMVLMCPRGAIIKYSGPYLNQDDSLVWQMIIRAARQSHAPMGGLIQLSYQDIITSLERTDGGANFTWLKDCLERLHKAHVVIETANKVIRSYLLVGYSTDKKARKIEVGISALLYPLFAEDLTDIDVLRKAKLKSQLSRWLHDFYSSHSNPVPYSIDRIQELARSNKQASKFKIMIEKSVEELKLCEPPLFAAETFLDKKTNLLHVTKATNSPGVPPERKVEDIINKVVAKDHKVNQLNRPDSEIKKIMAAFEMTEKQVQQMNDKEFNHHLKALKPIL